MTHYLISVFFTLSSFSFSMVFHPEGEPDGTWQDRPSHAVAAKVGHCSGTVIGPRHILTVAHFSMTLSTPIQVNGQIYYPEIIDTHPTEDIRLITVADAAFDDYIPIPTDPLDFDDPNLVMVISGWGKTRGAAVYALTDPNMVVGYAWSSDYGQLHWGTSTILRSTQSSLYTRFEAMDHPKATAYECAMATYDSGGGMFYPDQGRWLLVAMGCKVTDAGYAYFRNPADPEQNYGTLNTFLQTRPFCGWIKSIMYGPDITEDGKVDTSDLIRLQQDWLSRNDNHPYRTDLNRDGVVNMMDFSLLVSNWSKTYAAGDITQDGITDAEDAFYLFDQWLSEPGIPSADIAPEEPDGIVNLLDFAQMAHDWFN